MTLLFPERPRTRTEPLRRAERLFDFYNECGRRGYDEFRSIVNGWLSEMSEADQSDLISGMQRGGDQAFRAGLCELMIHAMLRRLGFDVAVHPQLEGRSTQPDFAIANQAGERIAYVEVTTINVPAEDAAQQNRESPIYNAIDGAPLPPGCLLDYELIRAGRQSPRLAPLIADIERWAQENALAAREQSVTRRFAAGDWEVELGLFSKDSCWQASNAIGSASLDGGIISPHRDIRKALYLKARKYGVLNAPYLIVVADCKDQLSGADRIRDAVTEAVMGDEAVEFRQGGAREIFLANGFWRSANEYQNQHVSGVLLLPDSGLWRLRDDRFQPLLALNPWAERTLPEPITRLSYLAAQNDRWSVVCGESLADILALPLPWPPED